MGWGRGHPIPQSLGGLAGWRRVPLTLCFWNQEMSSAFTFSWGSPRPAPSVLQAPDPGFSVTDEQITLRSCPLELGIIGGQPTALGLAPCSRGLRKGPQTAGAPSPG